MTLVGGSRHALQSEQVLVTTTSWTRVVQCDAAVMATASDEEWAFVAWCDVGHVANLIGLGGLGTGRAQMVVAFGDDQGPLAGTECRQALNDARFGNIYSWPSTWVQTWRTSGRGKWPRLRRPAIWARLDLNGDSTIGASFLVSGASILAFKLDSIGTGNWAETRYTPATAQSCNASSRTVGAQNWRTFHQSTLTGIFDGADQWFVASAVRFLPPSGALGAPLFQTTYSADGSVGAQVPILGRNENFGWEARSNPLLGIVGIRYQAGGFSLVDSPVNNAQLGLRGVCPNLSGQQTQVLEFEAFAVRASEVLGAWYGALKNPGTPPPAGNDLKPICLDSTRAQLISERELFEWSRPATLDIEVAACWSWRTLLVGPTAFGHAPYLDTDSGGRMRAHGLFRVADSRFGNMPEGVPLLFGATLGALGPQAQLQLWSWTNPHSPGAGEARLTADFTLAAWCWENDPDITSDNQPAVPAAAYLTLGRESLDVSLLPDLPRPPDVQMPYSIQRRGARLDAGDGTLITWPLWLSTREVWDWTWAGLTDAERDALLAVLSAQFRWTPPRALAARAFAPLGRARWTDLGALRSTVSCRVAALIWTG